VIDWLKVQQTWSVEQLHTSIETTYGVVFRSRQSYYQLLADAQITYKRAERTNPQRDLERVAGKKKKWPITCVQFAPHAPEQNPIEDVWLQVKTYVRKHWFACDTFQQVMHLFEEALETLTFDFAKLRMYLPDLRMI